MGAFLGRQQHNTHINGCKVNVRELQKCSCSMGFTRIPAMIHSQM